MKNCLGIEIGHYRIKIAYMERGVLKKYISERIEVDTFTDMKVYAEFIQDVLMEYGISCRNVVFVLQQSDVYVRRFQLPLMTVKQLKLNLPYEFQDYIGEELDEYQFDYGVIERTEDTLDIVGAACKKELCRQFQALAKMAQLKLVGLVPEVIGLERILERVDSEEKQDYAIVDLGTKALRIQFFRHGIYDMTRTMEPGCEEIERIQSGLEETVEEVLEEQYQMIAVQIMRVLNFYSFKNIDNTIDALYYCGGGARCQELIDEIRRTLEIPVISIGELFPDVDSEAMSDWIDSPQAFGVLLT